MKLRPALRRLRGYGFRAVPFSIALIPLLAATGAHAGVVVWTGAGGSSWASGSWNPSGPGTTDTASFTDTGSVSFPGTVTSVLNATRTIGGLAFDDTAGNYHTLELGGFTLNVAGSLNFNTDFGSNTTTTIRNGVLNVSGLGSSVYVGSAVSGGSIGIADLSNATSTSFTTQNFFVGESTAGGATGTLTLSASNVINSQLIQVGAANNSGDASGVLHLGLSNSISAGEFDIGMNNANGSVTLVNGGSVTLGSAGARTFLQVGNNTIQTNGGYSASLNLSNGSMLMYTSSLVVGMNSSTAGGGGSSGNFTAGGGTIDIGGSGSANFYAGYNISQDGAGGGNGNIDFSSLSSVNANVNNFFIGVSTGGGGASGTVKLGVSNTITANNILVGSGGGGTDSLTLGAINTISANQFTIAQDGSNAVVTLPAGGQLNLGSSAARTLLTVGNNSTQTNTLFSSNLNASAGTINAYLSSLIVGQNTGNAGVGGNAGSFTAGGGTIDIGTGTSNNVIVGYNTSGGGSASGVIDFSAMSSLMMNVGNFNIGTSLNGGGSQGNVKLAGTNTITATNITVGSSGGGSNTLTLGQSNTILVNQFTIGKDYSNGAVTIPGGGSLTLGSAAQPANLSIAVGTTNTNNTYTGSLDLTNAAFTGYLGNVIIGSKDALPGGEQGTMTIGTSASNYIRANAITLGGTNSTGTLNYGGGTFYAGSITKGAGTANFNWTGGTLSVDTFGSSATPFSLNNTGTGTLATGSSTGTIGTSTIYGNYTQGSAATTAIHIAGNNPVTGNDQVNISQAANLAGNLSLQLTNNFVPSVGQNFLIETYGSRSGTYTFVAPPTLPQNVAFQLDYTSNATQLNVRMVNPITQNYTSGAASGTFGTASNWDTNATPGTASALTINNAGAGPQTVTVGASTTVHAVTLSGSTSPLNFDVPQGIKLGVAYQMLVGNNAVLRGGGQVVGNVGVSGGTVSPNLLTVDGNYTAAPASTLVINLTGAGGANTSELAVNDLLSLGGTLDVNLSGYTPVAGDTFKVMSFGSVTGTFGAIDLPSLSPGLAWDDSQVGTTGSLAVVATPEPAAFALLSIAGAGLLRRKRPR